MAILISEEKKKINPWVAVSVAVLFILAILGSYLLFFTKAPLIEYIAPSSQKSISDISAINSDQFKTDLNSVKTDLQGKARGAGATVPSVGVISNPNKENPFAGF